MNFFCKLQKVFLGRLRDKSYPTNREKLFLSEMFELVSSKTISFLSAPLYLMNPLYKFFSEDEGKLIITPIKIESLFGSVLSFNDFKSHLILIIRKKNKPLFFLNYICGYEGQVHDFLSKMRNLISRYPDYPYLKITRASPKNHYEFCFKKTKHSKRTSDVRKTIKIHNSVRVVELKHGEEI